MTARLPPRPRIGVSACLLGETVRYNAGHCRDDLVLDEIGGHVDFVSVCPEFEAGLGAPRESLRLVGVPGAARLVGSKSGTDRTPLLVAWSRERLAGLEAENLHGYILKKNSPTCGMGHVRVYRANGTPANDGVGVFAAELVRHMPELPVEEEGRLRDPGQREHFITRVFARWRWDRLLADEPSRSDIVAFHTEHKMLLLAHDPERYRELGRLVAALSTRPLGEGVREYGHAFHAALARAPTRGRHVNVLQHLLGFLPEAHAHERADLAATIEEYRRGEVPLIVPERLIHHYVKENDWADAQRYFAPFPPGLHLRTRIVRS